MKENLVNILFEEIKIHIMVLELEQKGIALNVLIGNYWEIVLDIIGFPKDSSDEFYQDDDDHLKKAPDKNYYNRDWPLEKYSDIIHNFLGKIKLSAKNERLIIEDEAKKVEVVEQLSKYVDWLYGELDDYKKRINKGE